MMEYLNRLLGFVETTYHQARIMGVSEFVMSHEVIIRLVFFFGILLIMALWEFAAPKRRLTASKALRWINNLGIVFLDSFLVRIIFPAAAVGMAAFAQEHGWGLFNHFQVSYSLAVVLSVVVMDFVIYLQHVISMLSLSSGESIVCTTQIWTWMSPLESGFIPLRSFCRC